MLSNLHANSLKKGVTFIVALYLQIIHPRLGFEVIPAEFQLIIGVDDGYGSKSTGIPAKYACEKMGLSSNNVVAIGDAPMDYQMSMNSKLLGSILVETGQTPITDLLKLSPYCVKNLSEISFN